MLLEIMMNYVEREKIKHEGWEQYRSSDDSQSKAEGIEKIIIGHFQRNQESGDINLYAANWIYARGLGFDQDAISILKEKYRPSGNPRIGFGCTDWDSYGRPGCKVCFRQGCINPGGPKASSMELPILGFSATSRRRAAPEQGFQCRGGGLAQTQPQMLLNRGCYLAQHHRPPGSTVRPYRPNRVETPEAPRDIFPRLVSLVSSQPGPALPVFH